MPQKTMSLLCVAALSVCCAAQDTPPTFASRSELVVVPTVVTKDGKPLTGLNKGDFVLLHDGKPEPIAEFEEVEAIPAAMELAPLPPHTVQNYAAANSHQDVVILLLDFLNGSWSTAARMRSYLKDMTQQFADKRTPVTVLLLTPKGLVQVHSFTSSPENLTKTVEQWTTKLSSIRDDNAIIGWGTPPGSAFANPMMTTAPVEGARALAQYAKMPGYGQMSVDRGVMTMHAIQDISQAFRGIPGRKKLIWMSIGFPSVRALSQVMNGDTPSPGQLSNSQPANIQTEVLSASFKLAELSKSSWASLSDANIVVYPVDSNGATNPTWEEHYSPEHLPGGLEAKMGGAAQTTSMEVATDTGSLLDAAQKTGGQTCVDIPTKCIQKIQSDATHYYLLGFYLHGESKPGWHALKVSVKQDGASTRTRQGFLVGERPTLTAKDRVADQNEKKKAKEKNMEDRAAAAAAAEKDFINGVLASPLDYTSIPLQLAWSERPSDAKGRHIELLLTSPPNGVSLDTDSNMNLDYLAFVRPLGKTEGQTYPDTLASRLSPEQRAGLESTGFRYRHKLDLAPGRYEVRVLLRDNVAGKIGTVSTVIDLKQ